MTRYQVHYTMWDRSRREHVRHQETITASNIDAAVRAIKTANPRAENVYVESEFVLN